MQQRSAQLQLEYAVAGLTIRHRQYCLHDQPGAGLNSTKRDNKRSDTQILRKQRKVVLLAALTALPAKRNSLVKARDHSDGKAPRMQQRLG